MAVVIQQRHANLIGLVQGIREAFPHRLEVGTPPRMERKSAIDAVFQKLIRAFELHRLISNEAADASFTALLIERVLDRPVVLPIAFARGAFGDKRLGRVRRPVFSEQR
jgi:aspartate aminotransferase-like enzyme